MDRAVRNALGWLVAMPIVSALLSIFVGNLIDSVAFFYSFFAAMCLAIGFLIQRLFSKNNLLVIAILLGQVTLHYIFLTMAQSLIGEAAAYLLFVIVAEIPLLAIGATIGRLFQSPRNPAE